MGDICYQLGPEIWEKPYILIRAGTNDIASNNEFRKS